MVSTALCEIFIVFILDARLLFDSILEPQPTSNPVESVSKKHSISWQPATRRRVVDWLSLADQHHHAFGMPAIRQCPIGLMENECAGSQCS